jgi:hypothetical protein
LVALADSGENDGGFCVVPGFHRKIEEWSRDTMNTSYCKFHSNKFDGVSVPEGGKNVFFLLIL